MAGRAQYLASIRRFQEMVGKTADRATQEDIRRWVEHLQGQPIGPERLRCHYSALAFLFRKTLGQPEKVAFISMPRKDAPLPVILTKGEVDRVLKSFKSTTLYTQVSVSQIAAVKSPLDDLPR
jgi:site-specific recombinase XerD